MACQRCGGEEFYSGYCKTCYPRAMERRISKDIRANVRFQKGERLKITDSLCKAVVQDIIKGLPVVMGEGGREVLSWTADDELAAFCDALFTGKPLPQQGHIPTTIKLFLQLTDAEVEKLAELRGIEWYPSAKPENYAKVEELTKKYPELKSSLLKSIAELQTIVAKNI